jgi:type II secretory pathway pseudopilin PulG
MAKGCRARDLAQGIKPAPQVQRISRKLCSAQGDVFGQDLEQAVRELLCMAIIAMLQLSPHRPRRTASRFFSAGFALIEALVALGALGIMSGGAYIGFNAINAYATSSRLYSEAQAVAQNQIDLILSQGPFYVTSTPYRVPPVLCMDPVTAGTSNCTETPATNGPHTTTRPNVFVYTDPVTSQVVVTGTMTTTISKVTANMTYGGTTAPLNVRKAEVKVSYTFRNKPYVVTMHTFRTADQ